MKQLASNKRAFFDYDIKEKFSAGIALSGAEVKSIKSSHVSLKGSFISARDGELYLNNANVSQYKMSSDKNYDPSRSRKLLLHRAEIDKIASLLQAKGVSAVPLRILLDKNLIKVEIGVGSGKRKYRQKEEIKKRDIMREAQREIRSKK
jgi:SsrA-binding protein